MTVDLTLYLLQPSVTDVDAVFVDNNGSPEGYKAVEKHLWLPGEFRCWVKCKGNAPEWLKWLDGFDFGENAPLNQSSGCLVLLEAGGRVFAVAFGTGFHAIPSDKIDRDFGLTVALNVVNPKQLRTLVTKTIDIQTRQRNTHQGNGAEVNEFALDLDTEWLREAEGRPERMDCNVVQGASSLHLRGWKRPLRELTGVCEDLLATFEKGIPEAFNFVHNIKYIDNRDPLHGLLEADLLAAAQLLLFDNISVSLDARLAHAAKRCTLHYGRYPEWELPLPDDDSVHAALTELAKFEPHFDINKVILRLYNDTEEFYHRSLAQLLQMDIDRSGSWYVRIEERWFHVREDHKKKIEARAAALEETGHSMPPWSQTLFQGKSVHVEGDYNEATAKSKQWLLQDKKLILGIEPCDLLTPDRHFIHVKKGTQGSSELSHLFGQASGSADMLARDATYFQEMKRRYEATWSHTTFESAGKVKVILAIARRSGQDLFGKMLLSCLNCLEHVRRIQSRGYDVAIWRVDLV